MVIGFDASRAFCLQRTGTENYSFHILYHLLRLDKKNVYKIYLRLPDGIFSTQHEIDTWLLGVRASLPNTDNYQFVLIQKTRFWTQLGLACEVWRRPPHLLFIPAHTLPLIRRPALRTVVTIHDLGYQYLPQFHQFPQRLWLHRFTQYALSHADALIAVSEATKEDILRTSRVLATKIHVIYEGVGWSLDSLRIDHAHVLQARTKYSVGEHYLVFVGTIQPRKNLIRLIEAFSLLVRHEIVMVTYPTLQLVLIGKPGWLTQEIYDAPAKHGIADRVLFLGHVPDLDSAGLMRGSLCFVFPSLFEGFGIPILEAQSLGTPVVTSDKKPFTEVGGSGCCYVDPLSVMSIYHGMVSVLTQFDYAEQLRRHGFQNVTRFSWESAAHQTLSVFESLV